MVISICCLWYEEGEEFVVIWCCFVDVIYDFLLVEYWIELEDLVCFFLLEASLWVVVNEWDQLVGFMLLSGQYMDVLFIDFDVCGCGVGWVLVEYVFLMVLELIINVNE